MKVGRFLDSWLQKSAKGGNEPISTNAALCTNSSKSLESPLLVSSWLLLERGKESMSLELAAQW